MKDAIIVLAGGINSDGTLPDLPKGRVDRGIECFTRDNAQAIIMTGKYGFWLDWKKEIPPRSEAEAMKEYAVSKGVKEEAVISEETSKDTLGNAYFTKVDILQPKGWKNVTIVTSDFHLERTKLVFDLVLGSDYAIEYEAVITDVPVEQMDALRVQEVKTLAVAKEFIGDDVTPGDSEAIKTILFTKHPGYSANPEYSYERLREMLGRV